MQKSQVNKEIEARFEGKEYVLTKDLSVYTDYFGDRIVFIIPKGFRTDFASVPRLFWVFISPIDEFIRIPALVHDYLYRNHVFRRDICDAIFLEKMLSFDNKIIIRSYIAYFAVRLFGWFKYNKQYGKNTNV